MLKQTMWGLAIAGAVLGLSGPGECKPVDQKALGAEINTKLDKNKDGQLNGDDWARMSKAEKASSAAMMSTYFYATYKGFKKLPPLDLSAKADKKVVDAQAAKILKALDKDYMMPYTRKSPMFDMAVRAFTENHTKYNQ